MPRDRTTKGLAKRISLDYFKREHPLRGWKRRLSWAGGAIAGLVAVAILGASFFSFPKPAALFVAPGPVSSAHSFIASDCSRCHGFMRVENDRCTVCHDGAEHHDGATRQEEAEGDCAGCHAEHGSHAARGGGRDLEHPADAACTRCHAALSVREGSPRYAARIAGFGEGEHPEFAVFHAPAPAAATAASTEGKDGQETARDHSHLRLNHALHLKPGLRGENGPVTLNCSSCHGPGDDKATTARMAPVTYTNHCASCHPLKFALEGAVVPHDKPAIIDAYLTGAFTRKADSHPALTNEPLLDGSSANSREEWIARQVELSEVVLFRKDCRLCHEIIMILPGSGLIPAAAGKTFSGAGQTPADAASRALPAIVPTGVPPAWLPHAIFEHRTHRLLACVACHTKAPASQETSDILIPGIATCRECHASGKTSADCALCHLYHDRTKERGFDGPLTLPLSAGIFKTE